VKTKPCATVGETYQGKFVGEILTEYTELGKTKSTCMNVVYADTREEVEEYLAREYPGYEILPHEEFQQTWRKEFGLTGKAKLLGKPAKPGDTTYKAPQGKTYSSKLELLEGETVDTLVAPVAIAKRLGVPPQYVYQVISKGRIKTFGERPKKVRIKDIAQHYRKEVIPHGAVPPKGVEGETRRPDSLTT
jgi:hypothetical protein